MRLHRSSVPRSYPCRPIRTGEPTQCRPFLARPLTAGEKDAARKHAQAWGVPSIEETLPISFVGTGADLNAATENGLHRAAGLLGMSVPEVMNRATITGAIQIGRNPGVVTVTFLAPVETLERLGILHYAQEQYELQ